ncbi:hypothetical protein CG51_17360 [Haematobacter missouriensis]|uniref:Uncharacterized protein n=2 Tax=Haematobacter missouriensis TaxID=366616 RepID=A0A212ANB3_9RHOB|nr:avidin/streptavidin family protein [Haematobacter missouriensis]KFI24806.1 hypothetical protein CG51_17360 [Haematobacter missouriensis]OWJ76917.1 hypothetical protein CDV53_07150 [Haematobacter missouriensis]OWJ83008.1 hypothetical protein CDV52_13590 [Haematobacter missouriensis]
MSLAGVWQNEYGSRMSLCSGDGRVWGRYASTTGSTGSYLVLGRDGGGQAGPAAGVPVALAIAWQSVASGPADASWHWVSGLSGQICHSATGEERLIMNHLLVASCDFPGLSPAGSYLDKLIYHRIAPAEELAPPPAGTGLDHPLNGAWQGGGLGLSLRVGAGQPGVLSGRIDLAGRVQHLAGFIDTRPPQPGMAGTALTLTALDAETGQTLALAGLYHPGAQRLELQAMSARSTASADSYMQTALRGLVLEPAGA